MDGRENVGDGVLYVSVALSTSGPTLWPALSGCRVVFSIAPINDRSHQAASPAVDLGWANTLKRAK